jgi:uncharacterized phage-like protein YoqJ
VIVAFTGHRPDKLGNWDPAHPVVARVKKALRNGLIENWPLVAVSGMALGVDMWAAEACVELGIPFHAALPCDGWSENWPLPSRQRYQALVKKAAEIHVVSPGSYKPWKMQRRNEWMVDHCNLLLSIWDGSAGGTANCLEYADYVKRPVKQLQWREQMLTATSDC